MKRDQGAIAQIDRLLWLLKELEPRGIELYECQYLPHAFGSFVVVLMRKREYLRLTWDGKDFLLSVSVAARDPSGGLSPWVHDADISLPEGAGLYEEMASEAENIFAG